MRHLVKTPSCLTRSGRTNRNDPLSCPIYRLCSGLLCWLLCRLVGDTRLTFPANGCYQCYLIGDYRWCADAAGPVELEISSIFGFIAILLASINIFGGLW